MTGALGLPEKSNGLRSRLETMVVAVSGLWLSVLLRGKEASKLAFLPLARSPVPDVIDCSKSWLHGQKKKKIQECSALECIESLTNKEECSQVKVT